MPRTRPSTERLSTEEKSAPNSLIELIIELIYRLDDKKLDHAAELVDEVKPAYAANDTFSAARIRKMRSHIAPPKYWELEAVARKYGLPVGILLLLSRLRANAFHGNHEDTERIRLLLKHISETIKPDQEFSVEQVREWGAIFNGADYESQSKFEFVFNKT